jgi:uncharacterized membrane protein (UPF0182 family)
VPPTQVSTEAPHSGRARALIPTILIVIALAWLYGIFTGIWTDHLWFQALGFHGVFATQLVTKVGLAVAFGLLMGGIIGVTVWLVLKLQPTAPRSRAAEAYGGLLRRHRKAAVLVPAVVFAIFGGLSGAGQVTTYLAWAHQTEFGQVDARFGLDLSFYMFDYPWYRAIVSFLLVGLGMAAVGAAFGHFALGTLAAPGRGQKRVTSPSAHRHVAVTLALFFVVYGLSKFLDRYGQLLASGDLFDGLTYTGDKAQIGANLIMAVVSGLTAALFLYACVRTGWLVPITSVVLMVVTSIIVGMIYPAAVQAFKVNPNQNDSQAPYIQMNIDATLDAYGLEDMEIADYSATTTAAAGQLKEDAEALPGIRLIDPVIVKQTYTQRQQIRGFYTVNSPLDVDRYVIDGKETDVVIAAREIDHSLLDTQDWNNLHTVYTHGYGLIAAYGNRRQDSGDPDWLAYNIPTQGELVPEEPRIYFGEYTDTYAIVGRAEGEAPIEFDMPEGDAKNVYEGTLGVSIGNLFNRVLYATKFASLNLLLSDRVNANSQILYDREPQERVEEVAPWLTVDSDVYPALVDGRILWIVDAYTTSQYYPNSQRTSISEAVADTRTSGTSIAGLRPSDEVNYIRNSVKATVDAYTGEVTLYAWDETDPLLQTWEKVFPGTVTPKSEISDELMAHLRYPSDLFKIQRQIITWYHVTDPHSWFEERNRWEIPTDPTQSSSSLKEPAYYLSIRWPEVTAADGTDVAADAKPQFSLTTVLTPYNRQNLAAYVSVVAEATSPDYGRIRVLQLSEQQAIEGPANAFNSMTQDTAVADALLRYRQAGSGTDIKYGNLLTIPLGGGLLYVEPIYTQQQNEGTFPILSFVVVRFGTHTGIASTLQEALDQIFSGDAGADTGENAPPPESSATPGVTPSAAPSAAASPAATAAPATSAPAAPSDVPTDAAEREAYVKAQLEEAETQFTAAETALQAGDLGAYQQANDKAQEAIQKALEAMG